jgi:hypothetical protein
LSDIVVSSRNFAEAYSVDRRFALLTSLAPSDNLPVMRLAAVALVALALASSAAGCRRRPLECIPTCELRAKELNCSRPDKCKTECADLDKRTVCRAELNKWKVCFLALPKEKWFCDDEGDPVPFIQSCPQERQAVEACFHRELNSPNPPKVL